MMMVTAKFELKKLLIFAGVAAAVLLAAVMLFGGSSDTAAAVTANAATNDDRVAFLSAFGWEVTPSPVESSRVRIPEQSTEVFRRYNDLQLSQGYDLNAHSGKEVMRYVYRITNYPGGTEPVYATLLVYKNSVIGGDVTDTGAAGQIRTFRFPQVGE